MPEEENVRSSLLMKSPTCSVSRWKVWRKSCAANARPPGSSRTRRAIRLTGSNCLVSVCVSVCNISLRAGSLLVSTGLSVSLSRKHAQPPKRICSLPRPRAFSTLTTLVLRVTNVSSHSTQDDLSKRRPPQHHGLLVIKRPCAG